MSLQEFISEAIDPEFSDTDSRTMGRGEPGLPAAFKWRDEYFHIVQVVSQWKASSRCSGASVHRYLRRHYYKVLMSNGMIWQIYFVRTGGAATQPRRRWYLYSIESRTQS